MYLYTINQDAYDLPVDLRFIDRTGTRCMSKKRVILCFSRGRWTLMRIYGKDQGYMQAWGKIGGWTRVFFLILCIQSIFLNSAHIYTREGWNNSTTTIYITINRPAHSVLRIKRMKIGVLTQIGISPLTTHYSPLFSLLWSGLVPLYEMISQRIY